MLAAAAGVTDVDNFIEQLDHNGLDAFTDRPGDVLDLADYWRSFKRFGSFGDMVEHGVTTKLREIESYRSDSDVLSPAKARVGAERIAAALTSSPLRCALPITIPIQVLRLAPLIPRWCWRIGPRRSAQLYRGEEYSHRRHMDVFGFITGPRRSI